MRIQAEKTTREQCLDQNGAARPGPPPASTLGLYSVRATLDRSARCTTVGSRRLGLRGPLFKRELASWRECRGKQPSPSRLTPSRPSASANLGLRIKGSRGTSLTVFLRVAASSNPALEGTAHLRRFAGRWVPSSLRSSAAPQLRR
jgi:hypothetical protein